MSIIISACTTGLASATISYDFDTDPSMRKNKPETYGYIPDSGAKRLLLFILMTLMSTAHILGRTLSAALLASVASKTSLTDLKTTAKTLGQFKESFEKYRYARQMAFYTTAAQEWLDQNGYKMYEALNPVICAVETKGANRAGLFQLSDQTWFKGVNEKKDLLERLNHHFKNDQWTDDMETDIDQRYFL
mgnify:CR=1 FL=1